MRTSKTVATSAVVFAAAVCGASFGASPARFIAADDRDPRVVVEEAPAHSVILFDRNRPVELAEPLVLDKPLALLGLHARLPEGHAPAPLVMVHAEGVRIADFELHGNDQWTDWLQDGRESLLVVYAGDFTIERGLLTRASQHGILVRSSVLNKPICGGVIRDVEAHDIGRDGVSLEGRQEGSISHVLVDNVRVYRSRLRGAVEACDGADNITLRNIYAEDSLYAVDVMHDHGDPTEVMHNHLVDNVHAVRCRYAVRTNNRDLGHTGLTIRNVTAEQCRVPVHVRNITGVLIDGVRVFDHAHDGPLVEVVNSTTVQVRNVSLLSGTLSGEAIRLDRCESIEVDPMLDGRRTSPRPESGSGGPKDTERGRSDRNDDS